MSAITIFWIVTLFALGACLFALVKGGVAERLAAGVIILNTALGYVVLALFFGAVDSFRLVNDGFAAVLLLILAVRYAAPWLGGAMLFYAAQFAMHSYFLVLGLNEQAPLPANVNNLNWVGVNACLIAGTVVTVRRRARLRRAAQEAPAA
jgi:hypothetical protein